MKCNLIIFKIFAKGDNLEKKLLQKHLMALVILIAMVIAAFIIITNIISTQKDAAELINKSGKQRMLTQKVLTFYFQREPDFPINITQTLNKLKTNNQFLLNKLQDPQSLSFNDSFLYDIFNKKNGVLETLELYSQNLEKDIDVKKTCKHLFDLYEETTLYYENLLEQRVELLLLYETIILILSITTIILEGFFIFRPTLIEVYEKHNELKNLNKNLEEKVKTQIEHIRAQEQTLIQQAKMAEMGQMLSDISHQWKQPLTILSLQLDTINMDIKEDNLCKIQLQTDIEDCFKQIKHMHQTIEDFKNFYKPDTQKKLFDVVSALQEVIQMEKTSLCHHTINLEFQANIDEINIIGFEGQFKQVILTLINNAIEQISNNISNNLQENNNGKIKIELLKQEKFLIINVCDNAGGIDLNIIDKIFNPYFSTKHDTGGSGLGLYMAKTILEKNFLGKLSVQNSSNGACFQIVIEATA